MLSADSSSSNWDFTPVIDLLRSPTCCDGSGVGGYSSISPARHDEIPVDTSCEQLKHVDDNAHVLKRNVEDNKTTGYQKLGDFTSVWEFLRKPTATLPCAKTAEVGHPSGTNLVDTSSRSSLQRSPITILKRTVENVKSNDGRPLSKSPSPTPPRDIPVKGSYKSRTSAGVRDHSNSNERNASETNTEVDSDNSLSVFDSPLSKRRGKATTNTTPGDTPPSSCSEGEGLIIAPNAKDLVASGPLCVQPVAYKSASEQKVGLLTKLKESFPDYAKAKSGNGKFAGNSTRSGSAHPVHVFVDASNIMVGFHDAMKISRDIPVKNRIRRLPLSFHNFSLILERGRPVAKRVLVGSDRFPAIDEAEKIGYEANILDRVQKVKHLAPRRSKYGKPNGLNPADTPGGFGTNGTSGERWVEQGVDEILHLKILESLIDTGKPATMVLATGDAAEAEYSGGFMRMVERALQRGWTVELVSFWQITSNAYRRREFRAKWGNKFKMIKLDDYVEELWDM